MFRYFIFIISYTSFYDFLKFNYSKTFINYNIFNCYWFFFYKKINKIIRSKEFSDYDKTYILCITGKENITQYQQNIGFKHPLKNKRLELMIKSYNATSKNKKAFEKIKSELNLMNIRGQLNMLPV